MERGVVVRYNQIIVLTLRIQARRGAAYALGLHCLPLIQQGRLHTFVGNKTDLLKTSIRSRVWGARIFWVNTVLQTSPTFPMTMKV